MSENGSTEEFEVTFSTVIGKIVLAVIHNEEMSVSMGVRVNRVYAIAFAFGVCLRASRSISEARTPR